MAGERNEVRYRLGLSCQMGGRRSNNEDNFFLNGVFKTLEEADHPTQLTASAVSCAAIAVCDGMGGEADGELAALEAVKCLHDWQERLCERAKETVDDCIREMNRLVCERQQERGCRMGTTLVLAVLNGRGGQIYHVGDSRAYRMSNGALEQLTEDHTAAQALLNMGLQPKSQREYSQLTQFIGIPEEEMLLEAGRREFELKAGDRLLLCSDGLSDTLEAERIREVLSSGEEPEEQALRLTRDAEELGGKDNVTALVLAPVFEPGEEG